MAATLVLMPCAATPADLAVNRNEFSNSGGTIGGTFGAQIQKSYIVLGLEGDVGWANINGGMAT